MSELPVLHNTSAKITDEQMKLMLAELKERVIAIFGQRLKKIILFGSQARKTASKDSDVDIIILVDEDAETLKKYHNEIVDVMFDLSLKYNIVLSIIEKNHTHYYRYKEFVPFFANISIEGVEIYN
ncbi:MAG: nucleotidyltransferase domain-containing protein [Desulfotomaculum sp.]|nr:nucleotidyltransferase domain-containing protein [Desulfotomaculum sp.]MCL0081066.1 nucleotidyltransferase domain-containing protein [Peptococcaceae bacterium]